MSLQGIANYPRIVYYARRSRELGKLANLRKGAEAANVLSEKVATDACLVSEMEKLASGLMRAFEGMKSMGPIGKGLAFGTAAAVPLGLTGAYLTNRAEDKGQNLLKAGLGAAALGTAAFGLGRWSGGGAHTPTKTASEGVQDTEVFKKTSAAYKAIQVIRKTIDQSEDPDMAKLATETLMVANGHLADMVSELVLGSENVSTKVAYVNTNQGSAQKTPFG